MQRGLHGCVHDTTRISSCFSRFRLVSRTNSCSISKSPLQFISFLTVYVAYGVSFLSWYPQSFRNLQALPKLRVLKTGSAEDTFLPMIMIMITQLGSSKLYPNLESDQLRVFKTGSAEETFLPMIMIMITQLGSFKLYPNLEPDQLRVLKQVLPRTLSFQW